MVQTLEVHVYKYYIVVSTECPATEHHEMNIILINFAWILVLTNMFISLNTQYNHTCTFEEVVYWQKNVISRALALQRAKNYF